MTLTLKLRRPSRACGGNTSAGDGLVSWLGLSSSSSLRCVPEPLKGIRMPRNGSLPTPILPLNATSLQNISLSRRQRLTTFYRLNKRIPPAGTCLDNRTALGRVRLAVITIISSVDLVEQCHAFFRFYTEVQQISPSDIFIVDANASAELRDCYDQRRVPPLNVVPMEHRPEIEPLRRRRARADWRNGDGFVMSGWVAMASELQRELLLGRVPTPCGFSCRQLYRSAGLLNGSHTHTLIAELDEFIMPLPSRYSGLLDYVRRNPQRRTAAPRGFEVQEAWSVEQPLNWSSLPLLAQRSWMVPTCGLRKPIFSRVPTEWRLGTHNMEEPLFFACSPSSWGSSADCLDEDLWLVHTKCADLTLPLASAAYRSRRDRVMRGLAANSSTSTHTRGTVEELLRIRCGDIDAWRRRCPLGPGVGAPDNSDVKCRDRPVRLSFGIERQKEYVLRIPPWLQAVI